MKNRARSITVIVALGIAVLAAGHSESANPLDRAVREDRPLEAGEIASFLLEWSDTQTGLVPSSIAATGTKNPNQDFAYTYTEALAHQVFLLSGQTDAASKIAEFYRERQAKGNLPNAFDYRTGLCADPDVSAGPNAYWGISFLKQYIITKDEKWLSAARSQAEFLLNLQDDNGGIRKNPYDTSSEYYAKSTEENLDSYAFLKLIYKLTGEEKYKTAYEAVLKWLASSGVYDLKGGYFYIGSYKDKVTQVYGTDANALAVIILGPETLDAESPEILFGGKDTAQGIMDSLGRAQVTVDYTPPGGTPARGIKGYDFTDAAGRPGRHATISPEFTSQVAFACLTMADYSKDKGDLETTRLFTEKAKAILDDLGRIAARTGGSASLPYSTQKRIRRFSFDNWIVSGAEADISAAWVVFPLAGFNPFTDEGFKLRDSLSETAPWLKEIGKVAVTAKASTAVAAEKITSEAELTAEKEAERDEAFKQPVVYYEVLYEKVQRDAMLARRRTIAVLMTSFNCFVGGGIESKGGDYEVIGVDRENRVIRKPLSQMPEDMASVLREEYSYFDEKTGIKWRLLNKYNLNPNFKRGTYYAFEMDQDYRIVKQFLAEEDVPETNRADLRDIKKQFQSSEGLPEGHVVARYLPVLEVDKDMQIVNVYENLDQVPGMISKVTIDYDTYKKYLAAKGDERQRLLAAGVIPDKKGNLTEEDWGRYYAKVLAIDETKRLRISGVSVATGNDVIIGTRFTLNNPQLSELARLNAVKYEDGVINGMIIEPAKPINGVKPSIAEPVNIFLSRSVMEERTKEFRARLLELLKKVKAEKDAQVRQELIAEYDMISGSQAWFDEEGYVHVIYNGVKAAEKRLREFEVAKKRAEASLRKYNSILGRDEKGRDLRDFFGNVWLEVVNEATGRVLYVEVYDIAGNLQTIFADNIKIDPLTKTVTSDTRTDIEYDPDTYQMIGSHTYRTDENGDWTADVSEGIFRGYTPDRSDFVIERRIYRKNESGRILYDSDGRPKFTKKIEYYTPEGDIAAQVVRNIVTAVKYGENHEITREVFIDPSYKAVESEGVDLKDLIRGRVWVRRYKSTNNILSFRDALVKSLTSLPEEERQRAAVSILNRLGAEKVERVSDILLLEENEVTNNLSQDPSSEGEAPYFVFYEPGDSLGRPRMIIRGATIEIPVEWIAETEVPAKTLSFNLIGELVSISDVDKSVRADSVFSPYYLERLAGLDIEADTPLPQMKKRIFRMVTGEDGKPHFTNTVAITTVSYMIPDDVLGRELINIKYVMLGDETTLHPGSALMLKRNIFNQDTLQEAWKDDRGSERSRPIARREDTVIYEWYKEGMAGDELKAALIEDTMAAVLENGRLKSKDVPRTFEDLRKAVATGKIRPHYLCVGLKDLREALDNVSVPPFGTLPGYHTVKPNRSIGEIKYFSGFTEYPRSAFSHPSIKVAYESEAKPFVLPDGAPVKGVKYNVLNSDYAFYDVHSLTGQLIVIERRFIILRLMNILPVQGGRQLEYYDPLVPYSYLRPIKIDRNFATGTQPEGTPPGVQTVAVFLGDASIYYRNGWQTQTFLERRPFDIEHWIRSDYFFDENGVYRYKKEHIESSSIYLMRTIRWQGPLVLISLIAGILCAIGYACRRRLKAARDGRISRAEAEAKSGIAPRGIIAPFSREALERLEGEGLRSRCVDIYRDMKPPSGLCGDVAAVFVPQIEERFRSLGADPKDYTASIRVIICRIAARAGREDIRFSNLFAFECREFEEWSASYGHGIKLSAAKPAPDELTVIVLFRLIFDESVEFRAAVAGFRYFIMDKCLDMISAGKKSEVLKEIQSDCRTFIEALKPGYDKKLGLTKDRIFTYEDMKDLFAGKRQGFIRDLAKLTGQTKEQKLRYLATAGGKNPAASADSPSSFVWLKTFPDIPGSGQFFGNLKRFWGFLVPLFFMVVFGGIAIALNRMPILRAFSGSLNPTTSTVMQVNLLLFVGVFITLLFVKKTLGGGRAGEIKRPVRLFWLMFASASYLWGVFSIFVIIWTVRIIVKLTFVDIGWGIFISASAILLTFTFILSSFFSLFYIMIALFGFYQGKREGIGQVITWTQLRRKFDLSAERFKRIMLPVQPKPDQRRADEVWQLFWNAMIGELYDYNILNEKERGALAYSQSNPRPSLERQPRIEEARERIRFFVNSWLMEMPKADFWTDLPSFTAMITAFSEPVSFSFDELNGCDRGAEVTRLNHLISYYRPQWEEFVDRLGPAELGQFVKKEQLKSLFGLKRLPDGLSDQLKERIRRWANLTVQCVEKTAAEAYRIRDAFRMYAKVCYPQASEVDIGRLVDEKVQILLNYEGYHKQSTRDSDRVAIRRLMKEMPVLEVYWDAVPEDYVSGEEADAVPYKKDTDRGLHRFDPASGKIVIVESAPFITPIRKGKPSGLNQAISFVRGETVLFFDANCSVRIEDALKLPVALSEFRQDAMLGEVLFSEYIFNKNYSWISQAIGFNEETFVSVTQRTLNIFQACGFYGHSAIIRTDMITASSGFPQDYISEDILLATGFWQKGIRTTHKEYMMFGKGRETSYFASLVPLTKWAMGSSDAAIGRVIKSILESSRLHVGQKFMLMFGFSFFYQTPLMFIINFLYLWLMICWGINGFMSVPYPIVFGILGLLFNQAITATGVAYLLERYGFRKSLWAYIRLVAKNHFFYASVIPAYAFGFLAGLKGKAVFIISPKGWNLGHLPLKIIWGDKRDILKASLLSTIIGLPLAYILVAMKWLPLWFSPFIPFLPFAVVAVMYTLGAWWKALGLPYLKNWRDEIVPDGDIAKMSVIKLQMIYAIALLVFTGVGFVMWGLIFSSLAVKALFIFSALYISTTLSFVIMPLFAHSQPIVIFKDVTISKLWNHLLIPVFGLSVVVGMTSIISSPATATAELVVYSLFGFFLLIGWGLLKWKLGGYHFINRWLLDNIPGYRAASESQKADLMDDIYFAHQELLQGEREAEMKYARFLGKAKALFIFTLLAVTALYFISEFYPGSYSYWLWLIVAAEAVYMLILNIGHTKDDRSYLGKLYRNLLIYDFNRLNENVRAIEDIWKKLDRGYKAKLLKVYDDEMRAKRALTNYMSRCIRARDTFLRDASRGVST